MLHEFEKLKSLIFTSKSYRERMYPGKYKCDWLSQILILQEGSTPSLLAT